VHVRQTRGPSINMYQYIVPAQMIRAHASIRYMVPRTSMTRAAGRQWRGVEAVEERQSGDLGDVEKGNAGGKTRAGVRFPLNSSHDHHGSNTHVLLRHAQDANCVLDRVDLG
jgi:hypothetical protein